MSIYKKFNYSFLISDPNAASNINAITNLEVLSYKNKIREDQYKTIYTELQNIAKVESISSSNAIEGITATQKRITDIVNNVVQPSNHNELEILGYKDALNEVHLNYEKIKFNVDFIKHLHETMEIHTDPKNAGKFKTNDNLIIEVKSDASKLTRFYPLSANEAPEAMEQLCLAYQEGLQNPQINKILLIACVILDFLCIHPFGDGNGRMSRLLTLLLLYQNGYDVGKYISIEKEIEKDKNRYYDVLYQSSINWDLNKNNYWPFINHFILILTKVYKQLDDRFIGVSNKKGVKTKRIENILLNSLYPTSKQQIAKLLPDISITTIEAVIGKMLKENRIEKIGNKRNALYRKK